MCGILLRMVTPPPPHYSPMNANDQKLDFQMRQLMSLWTIFWDDNTVCVILRGTTIS